MKGKCRLTHKETELRNSHIYPKFVIEWMKETGSKYQRGYLTPDLRNQDGLKKYLLSENAEQLFSKKEKWFAENIFRPYLKNSSIQLNYNENLFYFSISVLWRILVLELEHPNCKSFKFANIMFEAEKQWRDFLLKGIYPKDFDRIHLILTDRLINHDIDSENVDNYFTRVMDGTTVYNENINFCAIYAKFSRFIFFGLLLNGDESKLIGTRIDPIKGILKTPQEFNEPSISGFFLNRIKQLDKMPLASEKQQEKIINEIKKDKNAFQKSDMFRSINSDIEMRDKNKTR